MKLLHRTAKAYFAISLLVLLISTPLFFFILNRLFIQEADETLRYRKEFVLDRLHLIQSEEEIGKWTRLEDDIDVKILPAGTLPQPDTLYDGVEGKDDYFRELVTQVDILGRPHLLRIRSSMLENKDLLQAILVAQVAILATLLLCVLAMNWWIAGRIWRPFYETLEKLKGYRLSRDSKLQLDATPILEFNQLNEVVMRMEGKIRQDFQNLKQFTENASHELQTPLAIIKSKLEVMVQDESLSEVQVASLQTLFEATGRLSRLNQGLLLLTRIENQQYTQNELLDFKKLTERTLYLFEDLIRDKDLEIENSLEPLELSMNLSLARILLNNLIGNAIRHNLTGGKVNIRLSSGTLSISNTGSAPGKPTEMLFQRFNKAQSGSDSLGLGLAIVREICDYYGFQISYDFRGEWHELVLSLTRTK